MKFFITVPLICTCILGAVIFLPIAQADAKDNKVCEAMSSNISDNPRLLILKGEAEQIQFQLQIWENQKFDFVDRDIVVITQEVNQKSPQFNTNFSASHMMQYDVSAYKKYFERGADTPFSLLLVGKDMGVKQRWDAPTELENIINLIDQMPMRIIEQQNRKK